MGAFLALDANFTDSLWVKLFFLSLVFFIVGAAAAGALFFVAQKGAAKSTSSSDNEQTIALAQKAGRIRVALVGDVANESEALLSLLNAHDKSVAFDIVALPLALNDGARLFAQEHQHIDADVWVFAGDTLGAKAAFSVDDKNVTLRFENAQYPKLTLWLLGDLLASHHRANTPEKISAWALQNIALLARKHERDFLSDVVTNTQEGPDVSLTLLRENEKLKDRSLKTLDEKIWSRVNTRLSRIDANRAFDFLVPNFALDEKERRIDLYEQAGHALKNWEIDFAGETIFGKHFLDVAERVKKGIGLTRAAREVFRRPVVSDDLLFFVDDLLRVGRGINRDRQVYLTPSRIRNAGITLHPKEVFRNEDRRYPWRFAYTRIDEPKEPKGLVAAKDGERSGPNWYLRYANPSTQSKRLLSLKKKNASFAKRISSLTSQLKKQGADVFIDSTIRARERGYLMWGAFLLSRCENQKDVDKTLALLAKKKRAWKLKVNIEWKHEGDAANTIEAARQMADAYGVVYATERGARKSDHYDGLAADFSVVGLPSKLTLKAPNGRRSTFDLSKDQETRDLSLSPRLIEWVEKNFGFKKLKADYPHWTDRKKR